MISASVGGCELQTLDFARPQLMLGLYKQQCHLLQAENELQHRHGVKACPLCREVCLRAAVLTPEVLHVCSMLSSLPLAGKRRHPRQPWFVSQLRTPCRL